MGIKFTQPVANPPICWICDRKLYGGGRSYVICVGDDGSEHPAHVSCAKSDKPDPEQRSGRDGRA